MSERTWQDDLAELRAVLRDNYDFSERWALDQSGEGRVTVTFGGHYDDWPDGPSCEVYSYVFGPHRSRYFDSVADALAEVKRLSACHM